jgi:hypothetical protein
LAILAIILPMSLLFGMDPDAVPPPAAPPPEAPQAPQAAAPPAGPSHSAASPAAAHPATAPAPRTPEQKKQDDIQRVMEFFKATQPDVYEQAKALRETDPAKFEKLIGGALSTVNHLEGTRRRNPKLFELCMKDLQLNYQSLRIAHELKRTDLPSADRRQLTEQLNILVAREFDFQQQVRQLEIEDLQKKVSDLDTQVRAREGDKENIIRKRVEDLTERTPRLEW